MQFIRRFLAAAPAVGLLASPIGYGLSAGEMTLLGAGKPRVVVTGHIFDASTGTRPTGWTFTRSETGSSPAWFTNGSGNLTNATANQERIDHTTGGAVLGLLIEKSSANLVQGTHFDLSDAAWAVGGGASKAASAVTAPDGSSTMTQLTVTSGAFSGIYNQWTGGGGSVSAGDVFSISSYVQSGTATHFKLGTNGNTSAANNLAGSLQTATGTTARFNSSVTAGDVDSGLFAAVGDPAGAGGMTAGTYYLYAAQMEHGGVTTTYISPASTRNAEVATFPATATSQTLTFDDLSTQVLSGLTIGATVTLNSGTINRPRLLYID